MEYARRDEVFGLFLSSGVIRDQWLVSAGGFGPRDGLKGTEIAFRLLQDLAPDLVMKVANRMELWPQASASSGKTDDLDWIHGL